MEENVTEDRLVRGYVSCIKINGKAILPPMMTPERRAEMKQYKDMAISIEATLNMKRNSVDSGVMIVSSSRSSSWANRKSVDIIESTSPENVHPSVYDEEVLLFELVQKYSSRDATHESGKHLQTSPIAQNKISTITGNTAKEAIGRLENVETSYIDGKDSCSEDMNISEWQSTSTQCEVIKQSETNTETVDIVETIPSINKGNVDEGSTSHSKNSHILHLSSNVLIQEQNAQSEANLVSSKSTDSVLRSSNSDDKIGTFSPVHKPVLQTTSPIADSAISAQYTRQTADESTVPIKKIQGSLNISEIIAQDDIIQDGLGFKVWKNSCEALKKRPQHSSTPADTTEEISNTESNRVETLDESVSSIAITASTDLNNYMDNSGSGKSSTSFQSLSSIAGAVHESEIVKQTTDACHKSPSQDQSICLQIETEAHRSYSKSISNPELQSHADSLGIDGIRPLDSENEVEQLTPPGAEVVKSRTTNEVGTILKYGEKAAYSTESNESRASVDSPPSRLKRQHSYILDSPSPLLVEHLKTYKYDGDMTASPTKKMLSSSEKLQTIQKQGLLRGVECNASLPSSSVTSPIKLQSPFASSDGLSSIVAKEDIRRGKFGMNKSITRKHSSSKENIRKSYCISSESLQRPSAEETPSYGKTNIPRMPLVYSPRYGSLDNVARKSCKTVILSPKTPRKTPRNAPKNTSTSKQNTSPKNSAKRSPSANKDHSTPSGTPEKLSKQNISPKNSTKYSSPANQDQSTPNGTPEKLSAQNQLRALFLQLQIEHQQQMAELVEKQKREQESMREAFRQQQNQLMYEIRDLCPDVFSTPESHKLLAKSITQPLSPDTEVGMKTIKNEEVSSNKSPQETKAKHVQENVKKKQTKPKEDENVLNERMEIEDTLSRLPYLEDVSASKLQNLSVSTSEVAGTFNSSNISSSQEVLQNESNLSNPSDHLDFFDIASCAHSMNRNNAVEASQNVCNKENVVHQVQHLQKMSACVHNISTSTSDIIEAVAKENISFSSEISSNKSYFSGAMTTESSENVECSDSIVTSGVSGSKATQQMLYNMHTNGRVISKMHHLDEISLSDIPNISTSNTGGEISNQICRSKQHLTHSTDQVRFPDATIISGTSDLHTNKAAQQTLCGMHTDGKVVSRMLTVAKSEVILTDVLPYTDPREETVRTTVFTQLNGSTMMQGSRLSCSRELFPVHSSFGTKYTKAHERAAARIQAGVRGYLTRRLFQTARVQDLITTIRDTLLCAVQLSQECWPDVQPEDVELHRRLIQQVTAACYALHDVFFSLSISEQMAIIAGDRDKQRSHAPRTSLPRPLSAATRRALERKTKQSSSEERPKTVRSRRTWSSSYDNSSGSYGIARSCLLRQQQQQQITSPQQIVARARHLSSGAGRRPWR